MATQSVPAPAAWQAVSSAYGRPFSQWQLASAEGGVGTKTPNQLKAAAGQVRQPFVYVLSSGGWRWKASWHTWGFTRIPRRAWIAL